MATTRQVIAQDYPLPVYNFRVTIDGLAVSFSEVSGLTVEHDHVTYRHGLSFLEGEDITTFNFESFRAMTLKRGTVLGSDPLYFHDWLAGRDLRSLEVSLCDEAGVPVLTWQVAEAAATKLEAPSFDAGSNDVAIDSLELQVRGVSLVAR